jgi:hypothetical protein
VALGIGPNGVVTAPEVLYPLAKKTALFGRYGTGKKKNEGLGDNWDLK